MTVRAMEEGQCAGITAYYNDSYHYEMYLTRKDGDYYVCFNRRIHDLEAVTACHKVDYQDGIEFKIEADSSYYRFYYKTKGTEYTRTGDYGRPVHGGHPHHDLYRDLLRAVRRRRRS